MNQYRNFIVLLITITTTMALVNCRPATADVPAPVNQNALAVFFDDFAGSKLDTAKWNVEITGMHFNNELQAYVDSASTISIVHGAEAEGAENGALQLKPKFAPGFETKDGQKFDFISGRINTRNKVEVAYGSIAARIKITDGAGLWPAWWMLGKGNWPETGEIDIMEYIGEKDWASAAAHGTGYSGDAALVDRLYFPADNDITQWHTYAVDWGPDSLVFKYDGVAMFRVTKPMTQFFGTWAFDNPKFMILNFAVGGVYPFKVNGIKQPYYGLSASTFEAIKNNKCKMLVDWVKVIKR